MNPTTAQWRKSSYSGAQGGNCVEVAIDIPNAIAVRDSKNPNGVRLTFSRGVCAISITAGTSWARVDLG